MNFLYRGYIVILFACFIIGLLRFNKMDKPSRIMCILIGITTVTEMMAYYYAITIHNNLMVYSVFNIVQMVCFCLYYQYSIDVFNRSKIGWWIAVVSVLAGIINIIWFQPLKRFNSYYLIYESIVVISLGMFAFFRMVFLGPDNLNLRRYPHFWFLIIWVTFWAVTLLNWSLYESYAFRQSFYLPLFNLFIILTNILTYCAIGIVFLFYPQLNKQGK